MSTVAEIEAAIKALPPSERERLAEDLPFILPELRGDLVWQRIMNDERPRTALSALGDQIETRFKTRPGQFPEIKDSDFEKRP
ncbi:MAG: hypothetical protein ACMG6H_11925, partial [Acidobacteriota bacterium]